MRFKKVVKNLTLSAALASLCGLGAAAQTSSQMPDNAQGQQNMGMSNSNSMSAGMGSSDQMFVKKAAQGGMAEVELGQLALQKSDNADVKKFAQRMVDDHTKANNDLKSVASAKNMTLPETIDAKDEATKQRLSKLSGSQFDQAYMSDMVKDHTKDVSEFKRESMSAKDDSIKSFASQTLPTLEDHLKEAKKINSSVMGSK